MTTGRTDYTLPTTKLEHTPTRLQVKPHDGFTPEAITLRAPFTLASEDTTPDLVLAKPAPWTTQAACAGDYRFGDEEGLEELKPVCQSCPVRDVCLEAALMEERSANGVPFDGDERTGIRGGLTPRERVAVAVPRPAVCGKGVHQLTDTTARLNWQRGTWVCKPCINQRKRERRARGEKVA